MPSRAFTILTAAFVFAGCAYAAEVAGRMDKPVKEVVFLERVEPKKFDANKYLPEASPAVVSEDGRTFFIKDLPPGRYDIRLRLEDGSLVEGVDLGKKDAPKDAGPLAEADITVLREIVANLKTFFDQTRVFLIDGWRGRDDLGREGYAWILVEQLRWRKTTFDKKAGEPFVIFRMDIWEFERMAGAWRKVKPYKVIYRLNVDVPDFEKYKWYFTAAIPPVDVKTEKVDMGEVKIPALTPETARIGFPEKGLDKPVSGESKTP